MPSFVPYQVRDLHLSTAFQAGCDVLEQVSLNIGDLEEGREFGFSCRKSLFAEAKSIDEPEDRWSSFQL